jgi:hypothetical protein
MSPPGDVTEGVDSAALEAAGDHPDGYNLPRATSVPSGKRVARVAAYQHLVPS